MIASYQLIDGGGAVMLIIANQLTQLDTEKLMAVYRQSNSENGREFYPDRSDREQLLQVEENFLSYLREDFFRQRNAFYAVLEDGGTYLSALRLEPHGDGWLLEALETHPEHRRMGYAAGLIRLALAKLAPGSRVYSHVSRRNRASLATHFACGFSVERDYAVSLDGTVTSHQMTLLKII